MLESNPTRGVKRPAHLKMIRALPCVICGTVPSEAAHVRFNDASTGKLQALGQKPDDCWVAPLCATHHREDQAAQHVIGEKAFWAKHGIDPLKLAQRLFAQSGHFSEMEATARQARRLFPSRI